ncbi:Unknown protein, partial [Striga hermonthica]
RRSPLLARARGIASVGFIWSRGHIFGRGLPLGLLDTGWGVLMDRPPIVGLLEVWLMQKSLCMNNGACQKSIDNIKRNKFKAYNKDDSSTCSSCLINFSKFRIDANLDN